MGADLPMILAEATVATSAAITSSALRGLAPHRTSITIASASLIGIVSMPPPFTPVNFIRLHA